MAANPTDNAIVCQVCGHKNLVGTLMCSNCGAMLTTGRNTSGTRNLAEEMPEFRTNPVFAASGSGTFRKGMDLRIAIEGKAASLKVNPDGRELLMGRRDVLSKHNPDIDFEDFEGYRLGVSRKHARLALEGSEVTLQDFGSANGTYLNGVRIPAHRPHKIHDGDEIRLGHLAMRIYFVVGDASPQPKSSAPSAFKKPDQ
jgi:hypothetical protein